MDDLIGKTISHNIILQYMVNGGRRVLTYVANLMIKFESKLNFYPVKNYNI